LLYNRNMFDAITTAYTGAKRRLFMLDYDGTLVNTEPTPTAAKPTPELLELLQRLCSNHRNTVAIISGRKHEELEEWLGHLPLHFAGEHGLYYKNQGHLWQPAVTFDQGWKKPVRVVMQKHTDENPGALIEEKTTGLVWHYRQIVGPAAAVAAKRLIADLEELAKTHDLIVVHGNNAVDVRISGADKGTAAIRWLRYGPWDFVLAGGDEATDEDLFKAMPPEAFTIKIGPDVRYQSVAKHRLQNPAELLQLLSQLTDLA
jgi:trehalose 6-phosphate synthase/phosphatase